MHLYQCFMRTLSMILWKKPVTPNIMPQCCSILPPCRCYVYLMSFEMYCNDNIVICIIQREFIISFIYTQVYKVVCRSEMFSSNRSVDCFGVCLWRPIYTNFSYHCFITLDKSKLMIRSRIPRGGLFPYAQLNSQYAGTVE